MQGTRDEDEKSRDLKEPLDPGVPGDVGLKVVVKNNKRQHKEQHEGDDPGPLAPHRPVKESRQQGVKNTNGGHQG